MCCLDRHLIPGDCCREAGFDRLERRDRRLHGELQILNLPLPRVRVRQPLPLLTNSECSGEGEQQRARATAVQQQAKQRVE